MIHDLLLRWVVTGLFVLGAAESGLTIITERRPWMSVVDHGLHFAMAVAMVVMAWPWSAGFPTIGPTVFFLLAALWFATTGVVAARTAPQRGMCGYHGLMMLAMAWMYTLMNGRLLPLRSSTQRHASLDTSMPGMDMAAMNTPAGGASPVWVSAVNWIGTVGFALAAVFWMSRVVRAFNRRKRRHRAAECGSPGHSALAQAVIAAGMAIMFGATIG
jgi:Trk-type K+ transport system membrane component